MAFIDLENRIKKRFKTLSSWARSRQITCFRLYSKDIPDYPLILEWWDGDAVVWIYPRKKDETEQQYKVFRDQCLEAILNALPILRDQLIVKTREIKKGLDSQYQKLAQTKRTKTIEENGITFEINLTDYLDTGLFLDHRKTRQICADMSKGKKVLNLFAYTGSFTLHAIQGGAKETVTVDLSRAYTNWTQRNFHLNHITSGEQHRILCDDCLAYLKHHPSEKFDLIICDPPTFSNSKKMQTSFSVDEHYEELINDCLLKLNKGGTLIFSTNSKRFKFNPELLPKSVTIKDMTAATLSEDFKKANPRYCWFFH